MFEDKLIFKAWAYNFLLLVVLVELLMFDLGALQGGDVVLKVIIKKEEEGSLETFIKVVTILGIGVNWTVIHLWKVLLFLVMSLFYLDL